MAGITTFLDESKMPNRTQDQKLFDNLLAAVFQNFPKWGREVNETLGALNSLAAGGVYAIPYMFDTATADADPGAGKLRFSTATQNAATVIRLDLTSGGQDYTTLLDNITASSSLVKGAIRLVKQSDLNKWMTFDVTARTAPAGYRNFAVVCTDSSSANPFAKDDQLLMFFQRNGDKGDQGSVTPLQMIKVSDQKPSGQSGGGGYASGQWLTRMLNTVDRNTIDGASLAGNAVTLPAGSYRFRGRTPGYRCGGHQAQLYNVTDSAVVALGSNAVTSGTSGPSIQTDSIVSGFFTITSAKAFILRHVSARLNGAISFPADEGYGAAVGSGAEIYSELEFEKFA